MIAILFIAFYLSGVMYVLGIMHKTGVIGDKRNSNFTEICQVVFVTISMPVFLALIIANKFNK